MVHVQLSTRPSLLSRGLKSAIFTMPIIDKNSRLPWFEACVHRVFTRHSFRRHSAPAILVIRTASRSAVPYNVHHTIPGSLTERLFYGNLLSAQPA